MMLLDTRLRLALLIAGTLFAWGCSMALDGVSDGTGTTVICASDDECEVGTCQFGICAAEPPAELEIALLLEPPAFRSDLNALHVTSLPVTLGSSLPDYALRPPIPVRGVVLFNAVGEDVGSPVEAELRFSSNRGIPGFEFEATTRSSGATGEYEIELPPGSYDVSIEPDRADVSQTTAFDVDIRMESEFKPFSIPAPGQYVIVSGRLERETNAAIPVAAAKVFARTVDGRHETTVDITDEDGRFVILAPPSESQFILHVRPTDESTWVPSATFEPIAFDDDVLGTDLRLSLGPWTEPVPVRMQIETPDGRPVSDAVLDLRSELEPTATRADGPGLTAGTYRLDIPAERVDDDGVAAVLLPPGRAEIYAAPLDPTLGIGVPVVIDVGDEADPSYVRVVIEERHAVSGRVVSPDGEGVAEVVIDASLRSSDLLPLNRYGVPSSAFGASTTSDYDGDFALRAQPGEWDIDVFPPQGSGLARMRTSMTMARGPVDDLVITLPEAGVVQGRLLDDENEPLAGASVQAFILGDGEAVPLGEGTTDVDGVYRLVLPRE